MATVVPLPMVQVVNGTNGSVLYGDGDAAGGGVGRVRRSRAGAVPAWAVRAQSPAGHGRRGVEHLAAAVAVAAAAGASRLDRDDARLHRARDGVGDRADDDRALAGRL